MLIFLYLAALVTALYWVSKILLPEMAKSPKVVPVSRPIEITQAQEPKKRIEPDKKTDKLEALLAEKNRENNLLQKELKIYHAQVHAFGKVKTILNEEIVRLREQNRIFRSELGLPAVPAKENSIT